LAALGFRTQQYALTIDFFCLRPYDTEIEVDYAVLSKAVPDDSGWLSAFHRARRTLCVGLINDLAGALAARSEPQARKLAFGIAARPPVGGSAGAAVVLADLVLARDFISDPAMRNSPELLSAMRRTAWLLLRDAAATGDAAAINLMISLLQKGRFIENASVYSWMHSYFWVLRSRRLGMPVLPVHAEIENAVSTEERTRIAAEEDADWKRSRP
jgi:hypothetical protein